MSQLWTESWDPWDFFRLGFWPICHSLKRTDIAGPFVLQDVSLGRRCAHTKQLAQVGQAGRGFPSIAGKLVLLSPASLP